jgi:hypothetical protein
MPKTKIKAFLDYRIPSVSLRTPQHQNKIETNQEAVRRAYHLEDGFIPIVTNHGSALKVNPVQRGIPLNLAPPGKSINFCKLTVA